VKDDRLVYSTDFGSVPANRPLRRTQAPSKPTVPDDGVVRVFRERGHRGGKKVTVIRGLPARGADLDARLVELKRLCGAGGTLRDGAIEVQGDHRERIAGRLRTLGYRVKLAGG
jgi:translation initiation factor 1